MVRIISLLFGLSLFGGIAFAADFGCSWNKNQANSIYLGDKVIRLTDNADTLKCNEWLGQKIIKMKGGNDILYTIKSDYTGTKIELNDGNDTVIQDVNNGVMANLVLDGGRGYDKLILNVPQSQVVIDGKCNDECKIYVKDKWGNPIWSFKNVTLRNFDEIDFSDGKFIVSKNYKQSSNSGVSVLNTDESLSKQINLSAYKYLIPAYWWSYDLNKKLEQLKNKAIVIINPSNGDFSQSEDVFKDEIQKALDGGNLPIGYIYTKYGKRDITEVENRINSRLKYYPNIKGFFFDEVGEDNFDYYQKIYNYVKSKNPNLVVILNPGTIVSENYEKISDNIVIYESKCDDYSSFSLPSWIDKYPTYKFSLLGDKCSLEQIKELSDKYGKYLTYFTEDGKDGNPWDSLESYYLKSENTANFSESTDSTTYPPYNFSKFHSILDVSKLTYPDSHTKVVDYGKFAGYKSSFFYANQNSDMVFVLSKSNESSKLRNELRQGVNGKNDGWRIDTDKIYHLHAKVKLQPINNLLEYTFLQIHSEEHPLLRMVVEKEKKDLYNHIWAVVRINTNDSGHRTNRYDLGQVDGNYHTFDIYVGNNRLIIRKDGKTYLEKDISYWPEIKNYFKAGIYDSKNSNGPWTVKLYFNELSYNSSAKNNFTQANSGKSPIQSQKENPQSRSNLNYSSNNTYKQTTSLSGSANKTKQNSMDNEKKGNIFEIISNLTNQNIWKTKISNLNMENKTFSSSILNQYYPLFQKFFNEKKKIILSNSRYWTEDYYNYLKSFVIYTDWLFSDLDSKNFTNIYGYLGVYKKVISKLSEVK